MKNTKIALAESNWPTCPKCGGILHWDADFMASELGLVDEDNEKEDFVVNVLHCPECDRDFYYKQTDNGLELVDVDED